MRSSPSGTDSSSAAQILLAVSALIAVVGMLLPSLLRPMYVVWMAAVLPIGWVVSHVLMAVVFYLLITPMMEKALYPGRAPANFINAGGEEIGRNVAELIAARLA